MSYPFYRFKLKPENPNRKTFVSMELPPTITPDYQVLVDDFMVRQRRIIKNYGVKLNKRLT